MSFLSKLRSMWPDRSVRRDYAAARDTRMTGAWHPTEQGINDILRTSRRAVNARVRQLSRDMPQFNRAVNKGVEFAVGDGIHFSSNVKDPLTGKKDKNICTKIEDAFRWWSDECDISGKLHLHEMVALTERQFLECGEFILVKDYLPAHGRITPLAIRSVEPDWLDEGFSTGSKTSDTALDQGIEFDKNTGRPMYYHFSSPAGWSDYDISKSVAVKADRVLHGFQPLRPGQLRGISPYVAGVLMARSFHELLGNELDGSAMASKWLAFITKSDPLRAQMGFGKNADGDRIEELQNGIIEYINHGETVNLSSPNRPGDNFHAFAKLLNQLFALATDTPYELLTEDYSGLNYTVLRAKRNDHEHALRVKWARLIRHQYQPLFNWFLDDAVLHGRLYLPNYFDNPYLYRAAKWQPPGMAPIDPLREAKAAAENIANGLMSPQRITAARGIELEDIYEEIREAEDMRDKKGIVLGHPDVSMNTAPNEIEKKIGASK